MKFWMELIEIRVPLQMKGQTNQINPIKKATNTTKPRDAKKAIKFGVKCQLGPHKIWPLGTIVELESAILYSLSIMHEQEPPDNLKFFK